MIYNGVDTHRFSPSRSKSLRGELGWISDDVIFGMVANFIPYKRHIDFVRSAAIIKAAVPRARFLLVGEDRGEMAPVKTALQEAGLTAHIEILGSTSAPELRFCRYGCLYLHV